MAMNLPTKLTLLRIGIIPFFIVVFYLPLFGINNYLLTAIYILAAITDWFDGYLARKWEQESDFGAFLDPVADKLLVGVALILLVSKHPGFLLAIPAAVIIGREITISALREWMANVGEQTKVAVSIIGKFKTTAQMLAVVFLLFEEPIGRFPTMLIGYLLLYTSAGLTLWSMLLYLRAAWPSLTREQ
ncbi:MAG: CDP-diacylglycerol--glycerol-3-phosphate 3-phosphatidyltransferase [Thiohalophilus sp.]|nr:CDP-diacylglycerol--glycerol-3-phosphate 3-phosphatidyltransferase [Thiohalophilus sp.]MDR9437483.1 CDP-diacylglycerol--glycerol-3-phosphate 3-phosphatidyltransferase [Thiohalophilus sp.]